MTVSRRVHLTILSLTVLSAFAFVQPVRAQWQVGGVLASTSADLQSTCTVAPDGYGGILIAWAADINGNPDLSFRVGGIFVQRIATDGTVIWGPTAVQLTPDGVDGHNPLVVPDGEGGAIVAWDHWNAGMLQWDRTLIQRVNFLGTPAWTTGGVLYGPGLSTETTEDLISDGAGGALVVFQDYRNGNADLFLQKLDASGVVQYGNGVPVCTNSGAQADAQTIADGEGGIIVVWRDGRDDPLPAGNLYAQRINFLGTALWTVNGVQLTTLSGYEQASNLMSDGASGVILGWTYDQDIYAQRLNYAGTPQWGTWGESIAVISTSNQFSVSGASDDNGGAYLAWIDTRSGTGSDVYGQRIDAGGVTSWMPGGIPLVTHPPSLGGSKTHTVRDGNGGAFIAYERHPDAAASDIHTFNVDTQGGVHRDELVASSGSPYSYPDLVSSDPGSAIVAWTDYDSVSARTRAEKVPTIAAAVGARSPSLRPVRIVSVVPNPFSDVTDVSLQSDSKGTLQVELFDVAGHRVHAESDRPGERGSVHVKLRARDVSGAPLPSGVYFLRVSTATANAVRRLVVVH